MDFDLPLYAVQRLADGTWLVRTQMGDPILPPVDVVAVLDEPTQRRAALGERFRRRACAPVLLRLCVTKTKYRYTIG